MGMDLLSTIISLCSKNGRCKEFFFGMPLGRSTDTGSKTYVDKVQIFQSEPTNAIRITIVVLKEVK